MSTKRRKQNTQYLVRIMKNRYLYQVHKTRETAVPGYGLMLYATNKEYEMLATAQRSQHKSRVTHPRRPNLAPILLSVGGEGSRDGYGRSVGELGQDVHRRLFSLRIRFQASNRGEGKKKNRVIHSIAVQELY